MNTSISLSGLSTTVSDSGVEVVATKRLILAAAAATSGLDGDWGVVDCSGFKLSGVLREARSV